MTKIASHNTMTYLPVRQWYLRPFAWMSKCQSKDIATQAEYTDFFELRVRFKKDGTPVFAHGLAEYTFDYDWVRALYVIFVSEKPYVMVHLEWTRERGLERQKELFREFCKNLEDRYTGIRFCGGAVKYDWSTVYKFATPTPTFVNYTASTTGTKVDDVWPWLFTVRHNREATSHGPENGYVRVDYVHTAK